MNNQRKLLSLAAIVSAAVAMSAVAPQAMAHAKHKHTKKATHTTSTRSLVRADERHLRADDARIANLESEVGDLRAQLTTQKQAADAVEAKQTQLETQIAETAAKEEQGQDLLFFRGGYAALTTNRHNELLTSSSAFDPAGYGDRAGNGDGWYVGAGFDHRLSSDFFGLSDMVALDGEVMFEYQNYGQSYNSFVSSIVGQKVTNQITMLTIAASPKIKFNLMEGSLRPWIIPFGLAINVVSPPSSGVTVLNPGLMLGTGIEYNLWKNIWIGSDFRYQFTGGDLNYRYQGANSSGAVNGAIYNQTPTQGLTAGGYIGVGF